MEIIPAPGPTAAVAALARAVHTYVPGPGDRLFLGRQGEALVGYIAWQVVLDEADLLGLAVAAPWRRRGLGRRLLLETMPLARLTLEVREDNGPARALYESLGFQRVGRRRHYYGPGVDALLLQRDNRPPSA